MFNRDCPLQLVNNNEDLSPSLKEAIKNKNFAEVCNMGAQNLEIAKWLVNTPAFQEELSKPWIFFMKNSRTRLGSLCMNHKEIALSVLTTPRAKELSAADVSGIVNSDDVWKSIKEELKAVENLDPRFVEFLDKSGHTLAFDLSITKM